MWYIIPFGAAVVHQSIAISLPQTFRLLFRAHETKLLVLNGLVRLVAA
jgi:hypothetical protein